MLTQVLQYRGGGIHNCSVDPVWPSVTRSGTSAHGRLLPANECNAKGRNQPEAVFTWRAIDTLTSTLAEFHSSAMRGRSVRPYAQGVTHNMLLRGVVKDLTDQGFAPPTLVGLPKN